MVGKARCSCVPRPFAFVAARPVVHAFARPAACIAIVQRIVLVFVFLVFIDMFFGRVVRIDMTKLA